MSKLELGTIIELESGNQYEVVKAFEGEYYDLKSLKPYNDLMPDYYPIALSVLLQNYKIITKP